MSSTLFVPKLEYFGNKAILNNPKIGFLCSRKVPAKIILKTYDWAIKQRTNGNCIISGFHSKIEKDVFDILVKGTQPIIIVLARGMQKRWSKAIQSLLKDNRLLIISPFKKQITRVTSSTALKRNELIFSLADEIFIPYSSSTGLLSKSLAVHRHKIYSL